MGIAQRSFQRVFDLADHIVVTGARMDNGLLVVDLKRELPEALKPRRIEIGKDLPQARIETVSKTAA